MKSKTTALHLMGFILNILMMVLVVFVVIQLASVAYNLGYRVFTEPGLYTLNTSMTAKELMQVMAKEENEEIDE